MGDIARRPVAAAAILAAIIITLTSCTDSSRTSRSTVSQSRSDTTTSQPAASQSRSDTDTSLPTSQSTAPPPLTAGQSTDLSRDLAAGTQEGIRAAVVVPPGQQLDLRAVKQLQAAGPITFDEATFHRLDAAEATVTGRFTHPPAGQPEAWLFTLTYIDETWKIVDMEPAR